MELDLTDKPRILVIDDDEQVRCLLLDLLGEVYNCPQRGLQLP
jgi:hypothetical protein